MPRRSVKRLFLEFDDLASQGTGQVDDSLDSDLLAFRQAGRSTALAFAAFGLWVDQVAKNRRLERTFLLSREGPFMKGVVDACASRDHNTAVLEVSRLSTFLASVEHFDHATLMRLWERFPEQSPNDLLMSLGLAADEFEPLLREHGLDGASVLVRPWTRGSLLAFLSDPEFVRSAEATRDQARDLVLGYLSQMGATDVHQMGVVDVGWRGTIQDSLANLLPSAHSTGLYLAHRPADLPQPHNVDKLGYLAGEIDGRRFGQELRLAASPLEMLTTGPGGSTVGYLRSEDGSVVPERRPLPHEEELLGHQIAHFQEGVHEMVGPAKEWIIDRRPLRSEVDDDLRPLANFALRSLLFDPPSALTSVFSRYQLDQSFAGTDLEQPTPVWRRLADPRKAVKEHGWPHAAVKASVGPATYRRMRSGASRLPGLDRWIS